MSSNVVVLVVVEGSCEPDGPNVGPAAAMIGGGMASQMFELKEDDPYDIAGVIASRIEFDETVNREEALDPSWQLLSYTEDMRQSMRQPRGYIRYSRLRRYKDLF